ncbi:MAG: MATE family efflux transporter [Anaerocolumna aminovalerica]|uniref:MATE family efflux transporter n=1 Tax=Anaerocolumna aminovalerica TaxID=1527 RepID=UPI002906CD44|nr:MATE family efflux transporter [Anaerocolumna aminovalerica]MDU6262886.1 MATE family efflux transporter [Anaerocolumna aminovalerica]
MFTKKQLYKLIIPLIIEQLLAVAVGMSDTMMVSYAGEAAMSGVSLVDTLNILLINVFAALATGGAVVASQFLGHKDEKEACKSGSQLLLTTGAISIIVMLISIIGNYSILHMIYGDINPEIMKNARIYFYITAMSFPFIAIYNSCAALCRAMGNSKVSMKVSLLMNLINITGNAILIYGFRMSAEGVAIPTLISRLVASIVMLFVISNKKHVIHIDNIFKLGFDWKMIKRILRIGIPSGLENSMFQIGKILVQGLIASFGLTAISANAVAGNLANFQSITGSSIGLAMITVIGQCVGANNFEEAKNYTKKLMKATYTAMFFLNIGFILLATTMLQIYNLSSETLNVAYKLVVYHAVCGIIFWPLSFTLPNALRAANDVKFTMLTSILSMWLWRITFSYILGRYMGLGVYGVWFAMTLDWMFRGACFVWRFLSGKWKHQAFAD